MMSFIEKTFPLVWRRKPLLIAAVGLLVAGLILGLVAVHKTITLVVNGSPQEITTYALTTGGVLREQGLVVGEKDQLSIPEGKLLWGEETIHLNQASLIHVFDDDQYRSLISSKRRPANILHDLEIPLYPDDELIVNGHTGEENHLLSPGESHTIQIRRAAAVELQIDNQPLAFHSSAPTLAGALYQQDIPLYEGDRSSQPLGSALAGKPLEVSLTSSKPVLVQLPQETLSIRSTGDTVGSALADAGLPLQGLDYSIPAEQAPLPREEAVQIIRVQENYILNQEPIEFTSQYQATNDLELDQVQILEGGEYGLKAQRIRVVSENGSEISREVEKEWVVKEPQPRIIGYGTQINIRSTSTPNGEIRYWRKITAYATSYNKNCPGCDNWTASGTRLQKGTIAVTLEWYRYMKGAKVYIPGYGFGTIEDVGGGIPGKFWVDLGYEVEEYVPWSQNVEVYFLAPPPPPENIMYVLY